MRTDLRSIGRCRSCGKRLTDNYARCETCLQKDRVAAKLRMREKHGWKPWQIGSRSFQPMEP